MHSLASTRRSPISWKAARQASLLRHTMNASQPAFQTCTSSLSCAEWEERRWRVAHPGYPSATSISSKCAQSTALSLNCVFPRRTCTASTFVRRRLRMRSWTLRGRSSWALVPFRARLGLMPAERKIGMKMTTGCSRGVLHSSCSPRLAVRRSYLKTSPVSKRTSLLCSRRLTSAYVKCCHRSRSCT